MTQSWIPTIGLEIHIQLKTARKLFSFSSNAFGAPSNTQASFIDLGLPGTLPIPNLDAIRMAIKFGLALDSDIATLTRFSRKNYFYPDLPKGYQITQDAFPIIRGGSIEIQTDDDTTKTIALTRAHLEEDAGKSIHDNHDDATGLDYNRAGVPLLEIVTEPQLANAKEAILFLKKIHALVVCLDICSGNMQEGAFRCDANVSVRPNAEAPLGNRVEIKNLNSFKFIEKAINYEIERQIAVYEDGGSVTQETRLFDPQKGLTRTMRSKENADDYRYFPDPDLPSISIPNAFISEIGTSMPELPWEKASRFSEDYLLSAYDCQILTSDMALADYFEQIFKHASVSPKNTANWVISELLSLLNKNQLDIQDSAIQPQHIAQLMVRMDDGTISGSAGKKIMQFLWETPSQTIDMIISQHQLKQNNNQDEMAEMIDAILADYPSQLAEYLSGKEKLFGFFVGQAMKRSKGQANPKLLNSILMAKLKAHQC